MADTFSHWRRLAKILAFVSAQNSPRPPCIYSGRADNACTNLLGFLVCYVRTRGSIRLRRAQNYRLLLYPLPHALATHYFLRLTRARRQWFGRRTARVLLADFWYFWSRKSTREEKLLYDTSLSEFFSLVRKERKGQKEESFDSRLGDADTRSAYVSIPLLNSFCRLAATGANKVPPTVRL